MSRSPLEFVNGFLNFNASSTAASNATPLPQLSIDSKLSRLQRESKKYFTIDDGVLAQDQGDKADRSDNQVDDDCLAVGVLEHFDDGLGIVAATFAPSKCTTHHQFVNECTNLFSDNLKKLRLIDNKIITSIVVAIVANVIPVLPLVSWLPFVGWIGLAAWTSALYFMNQRAQAYTEYSQSLILLAGVCNWSLGSTLTNPSITEVDCITKMMSALKPILTKAQTKHLIADHIEKKYLEASVAYDKSFPLFKLFGNNETTIVNKAKLTPEQVVALKAKGANFVRCVYGLNKGGVMDFVDAVLAFLTQDIASAGLETVRSCIYSIPTPTPTTPR